MSETTFCSSNLLTLVSSLVFDSDTGNLYAANFGNTTANIVKINSSGVASLLTQQYNDRNFSGMAYFNGFLYVTGDENYVYKVNAESGELTTFATLLNGSITAGITYWNNNLYVVCNGLSSAIYQVNVNTATVTVFINGTSLSTTYPNYIATDSNGNFYITDNKYNRVLKYNSSGSLITRTFISNVTFQTIIFYNNYFYFTNYDTNFISQYDINGNLITDNYAVGGLTYQGGGIAFDNNGNFYVSNSLNGETTIQYIASSSLPPTPPLPISNICFPANTPVTTDQGIISIDKINPNKHTINNKKIVAITKTMSNDKYLVCFEKDSLGSNLPTKNIIISKNHKIYYNGEMMESKHFIHRFENVKKVAYNREVLYNVLMENYATIQVNNLICETLDPKSSIGQLYATLSKYEVDIEERDELIEYIITKLNKNDIKLQKCIKK
jgi:sugar lactone lactonase YvrE